MTDQPTERKTTPLLGSMEQLAMALLLDRIMGLFAPTKRHVEDHVYIHHDAFHEAHAAGQLRECWYCQRWDEYRRIVGPFPSIEPGRAER